MDVYMYFVCVVVMERILTVPSSAEIAKIDKESFHQQKFKSAAGSSAAKVYNLYCCNMLWFIAWWIYKQQGKKSSPMTSFPTATTSNEQDHDNAIFGSGYISLNTNKSSVVQEEPVAAPVKVCVYQQMEYLHVC